ncbi:MAG: FAD-binding oxidoreductase [Moraxellaceae bacterium]|nr:MAG: FAD-binding oxidoreductase [Moraxellaceae bacterium]
MTDQNQPLTPTEFHTDILLLGGGIAGLYLLKLLNNTGYRCMLIEKDQLGGGQTLQSQGIIHGGLKYALGGNLNAESDAIKEMPDRWRKMLNGEETVKLTGTKVISKTQHMWSTGKFASKFTSFFASKLIRGRIEKLKKDQMPTIFQSPQFKGSVYKLTDLVIDTPSLIKDLYQGLEHQILQGNATAFNEKEGLISATDLTLNDGQKIRIHHQTVIFSAGAGNQALTELAGIEHAPMQRRPLHMVMVKHDLPHSLYAHGIGNGSKPRITITSHATDDGKIVWYLGGEISETGVDRDKADQVTAAKKELDSLFPWLDFSNAEWSTFFIDRAEPLQQGLTKPDCAYAHAEKNAIVTWPTKLTLAPNLGDRVLELIEQQGVVKGVVKGVAKGVITGIEKDEAKDTDPSAHSDDLTALPHATIATPKWESLF